MGVMMTENLLGTVRTILKTLECSICLDLLKTPVSIGCSHFFCRECVSEVLKSNYRAPCPLCKKSFTRRSIQGAAQRLAVITATKALVEKCEKLTGIKLLVKESSIRENANEESTEAPTKKQKSMDSNEKSQSKKRKSCEDNNDPSDAIKCSSDATDKMSSADRSTDPTSRNTIYSDVECSSSKRQCQFTKDESESESEELPSLEDLLAYPEKYQNKSDIAMKEISIADTKQAKEMPLSINPTEMNLPRKTYSRTYLKMANSKRKKTDSMFDLIAKESSSTNLSTKMLDNLKEKQSIADNSTENGDLCLFNLTREVSNESEKEKNAELKQGFQTSKVIIKNKRNALKNKTNKVSTDEYIMNYDCFLSKNSDQINELGKANDKQSIIKAVTSKENEKIVTEISETTIYDKAVPNDDPLNKSKHIKSNKLKKPLKRKPSKTKIRNAKADTFVSSSSADEESNSKTCDRRKQKAAKEETVSMKLLSKYNVEESECYNLNETTLTKCPHNQNENTVIYNHAEEVVTSDDPAYTDTAISVHSVTSPPINKLLSLSKSPGWSRVKRVGKDFRVKTFSTLSVEKNLPNSNSKTKNVSDTNVHNMTPAGIDESIKFMQLSDTVKTKSIEKMGVLLSNTVENENTENEYLIVRNDSLSNHNVTKNNMLSNSKITENENISKNVDDISDEQCANRDQNKILNIASDKVIDVENCSHEESLKGAKNELEKPQISDNGAKLHENKVLTARSDDQNEITESICESLSNKLMANSNETGSDIMEQNDRHLQNSLLVSEVLQKEYSIKKNKSDESCTVITVQVENPRLKKVNIGLNYEGKTESNTLEHINVNDSMKTNPIDGKQVIMNNENTISDQTPLNVQVIGHSIDSKRLNKAQKYLTKSDGNLIIQSNTLTQSVDASSTKNAKIFTSQKYIEFRNVNEENKERMYHFHSSELRKKSEFASECKMGTSESIAVKNQNNVDYIEHSQQTSQAFFDDFNKTTDIVKYNCRQDFVLGCSAKKRFNEVQNNSDSSNGKSYLNERVKENLNASDLNSGKTKVLKRTCLTLDEIQDCFLKSSEYGQAETICSLPFLSGQFRLDVCVSEETLNISVLKTMDSKLDNRTNLSSSQMLVKEKCVQTSNFNSPAHSPRILPSSNPESETSLPDLCKNVNNNNDPFPLLKCSISTLPQLAAANVELSNKKDLYCAIPEDISSKLPTCEHAKSSSVNIVNEAMHNISGDNLDETDSASNVSAVIHDPKLMFKNCELTKQNNIDKGVGNSGLSIKESNEFIPVIDKSAVTLSPEPCVEVSQVNSENKSQKSLPCNDENLDVSLELSSEECDPFIGQESIYRSTPIKASEYKHLNEDSEGFSSDPDMVFANELVAPLKIIAEKMDCRNDRRVEKDQDQKQCTVEDNCRDKSKQPSESFNEEKIVQMLDLCKNKVVHQKPGRLSLKMKRNSAKYKRIQNYDSSDDSDCQELDLRVKSGNHKTSVINKEKISETSFSNNSCTENSASYSARGFKQVPNSENNDLRESKSDGHSEACESGEDPNTLNSNLSDDIPNANASEIIMEIEDLDKKIKSLEEKLKQCGHHEDLKSDISRKSPKCNNGKNEKLPENNSSFVNLEDSEDSTDLFPQSVPPTPPGALLCSDTNSLYKCF